MSKTNSWLSAYILDVAFVLAILATPIATTTYVEQVITILPGANNKNTPAFFDVTFYPIQIRKRITLV